MVDDYGDVDGDGYADIVVGAYADDGVGSATLITKPDQLDQDFD